MNQKAKIFIAEVLGTMFLVVGGCGTAVFAATKVGFLGVATAFGLSLLVMAYAIGHISGCHINPAVTLGMAIAGKIEMALIPIYWLAQFIGGALGGFLLWTIFKVGDRSVIATNGFASNGFGVHSPDLWKLGAAIIIEILLTALLIVVVLSTTTSRFPAGFGGVAAGFTLFLIHLISIPIDNTSVNPARSFGVAIFSGRSWTISQLWVFIVFPLIGGALGAGLHKLLEGSREASAA
jgi:aquaporin Z